MCRGLCRSLIAAKQHNVRNCRSSYFSSSSNTIRTFDIQGTVPKNGNEIKVGHYAEISRLFTLEECKIFAGSLVGDSNPLHTYSGDSLSKAVVPGLLSASLFSAIFGTKYPRSIYCSQNLKFRSLIYVNESITGRIEVTRVKDISSRGSVLVICKTEVIKLDNDEKITCIDGEAQVLIPYSRSYDTKEIV